MHQLLEGMHVDSNWLEEIKSTDVVYQRIKIIFVQSDFINFNMERIKK